MLESAEIIAFVPTRNPGKARRFYETTLGLPLVSEDEFAHVFDANGTMLRVADVSSVKEFKPASFTILGWEVNDVSKTVSDLRASGVVFEHFEGMEQDRLEIWTSPSGARIAWFKDPDGNILSVSEFG